jgi:putative PEP-CTERM system TPR-repeat lipoprotein
MFIHTATNQPFFGKPLGLVILAVCLMTVAGYGKEPSGDADYVLRARQYQDKGKLPAAIIELKNALQQNPNNAEARWLLGKLYIQQGDGASAQKELERAYEAGMLYENVVVPLGKAYLLQQDYQAVLNLHTKDDMRPEARAEVLTLRGQAYQALGKLEAAGTAFHDALAQQPAQLEALLGLGWIALQQGKREEAKPWLDKALAAGPDNAEVWQLQGSYEQRQANWPAAETAFNRALALNAGNLPARIGLVEVLLRQGKVSEAGKTLDTIQGEGRQQPQILYYLALIDFIKKDYAKAEEQLQELFKTNSDHPLALQLMALTQYTLGNMQQAEDLSQRVLQRFPDSSEARKLKALIELRKGSLDPDKLQAEIDALVAQFPQDAQVLNAVADALQAQGKSAEAADYLKKVVELEPDSAAARVRLSQALIVQGKPEQAIPELEKAKKLGTRSQSTDWLLINSYLKAKEFDRALTALQPLQEKEPQNAVLWNLAGLAYVGKGQPDKAQAAFRKTLELAPGDPAATINLAQLALVQGKTDEARRYYRQGLEHHPDDLQLLLRLAGLESRQGNKEAYIKQLDEAIKQQPSALQPRLLRAHAYLEENNPAQARTLLLEVQEQYGANPDFLLLMGDTELVAGDANAAIRDFKKLLTQQPDSAVGHYWLASAYSQKGDFKQIQEPLFKALQLQPDSPLAWPLLEQLVARAPNNQGINQLLQALQASFPKNRLAMAVAGQLALQGQDYPQAAQVYQQALTLFPDEAGFTRKLAETYLRLDNQAAFLSTVQNGLKNHPQDMQMQRMLADYYLNQKRDEEARTAFTRLLEQTPDNPEVLNNLAWLLRQQNPQQARQYAEKALALAPANVAIMDTLGMILLDQGEKQRALELLRKASQQQPGDRDTRYHLAKALAVNDQKEEARRVLRKTLNDKTAFDSRQNAETLLKELGD